MKTGGNTFKGYPLPCRQISTALICLALLWLPVQILAIDWQQQRQTMLSLIRDDVARTVNYTEKKQLDERVITAMNIVPRHHFVPLLNRPFSYLNRPLSIGYGQTISQPFIVALMTDLLAPQAHHRVLEIGTGSGYQAAVLSQLVKTVYSVEIIPELAKTSAKILNSKGSTKDDPKGYPNVVTKTADGYYGWPQYAPFDGIMVSAVGGQIPPPLLKQLRNGGRMVLPVGEPFSVQYLMLVEKSLSGAITTRQILPVLFVPFTGTH